jgi:hypothetical protein
MSTFKGFLRKPHQVAEPKTSFSEKFALRIYQNRNAHDLILSNQSSLLWSMLIGVHN